MKHVSKAGIGIALISILKVIFPLFGVDIPAEQWAQFSEAAATVVGFVLMVWGQLDRRDLTAGIVRKQPK